MKTTLFFLLIILHLLFQSCSSKTLNRQFPVTKEIPLTCGENHLKLVHYLGSLDSNFIFINVHEDEQTSIDALRIFAVEHPINYLYLHHKQTRRVFFEMNNILFNIDPNRMFTDAGRKKTLLMGEKWSNEAQKAVQIFSMDVLRHVKDAKVIVALHNNTANNYSIQSYMQDSSEAQNTAALFINPKMDPDDFIYTTHRDFFEYFKSKKVNAILQDNSRFVDDGSLSVYCGIHSLPYINIETEHGHLKEQIQLIQMLYDFQATR